MGRSVLCRSMSVSRCDALEVVLEAHAHVGRRAGGELRREIAVGGDDEERRAVQGVGARREHRDGALAAFDLEVDVGADGAADPVALHPDDLLRPEALELVEVVEQAVGVVGDLEVPLRELLLHDLGAAPLAAAVDDLLVGEHRLVVRAPVDRALLAVGQVALVQALEQPLVPAVVLRVAGVEDAGPVVGRAVLAEALLVLLDVRVGPLARLGAALDRGVLGGEAERVPADRVQHVVAAVTPEARDDVDVGVALGVTHVQVARGVGEHAEHVLAGAGVLIAAGAERVGLGPARLPLLLDRVRVVAPAFSGRSGVGREVWDTWGTNRRDAGAHESAKLQVTGPPALTNPAGASRRGRPSGPRAFTPDLGDLGRGIRSPGDAAPAPTYAPPGWLDDRADHHREVERAVVADPAEASRRRPRAARLRARAGSSSPRASARPSCCRRETPHPADRRPWSRRAACPTPCSRADAPRRTTRPPAARRRRPSPARRRARGRCA